MIRLKKLLFLPLAISVGLSVLGCENSSSGGSGNSLSYDASCSGTTTKYEANTIIKNKVVNLSDADVYYEYLKFTSESGGEYSVYKVEGETYTKLNSSPVDGVSALPTSFSYDNASGKFSATANDVTTSTYLLETSSGNIKVSYIASEILTSDDDSNSLFKTWSSALDNISFTFDNSGYVYVQTAEEIDSVIFGNASGYILVDYNVPFLWANVNGSKNLYYKAYTTERNTVEEVGRNLNTMKNHVEFTSSSFMLLK